jgi:hypothetical protein
MNLLSKPLIYSGNFWIFLSWKTQKRFLQQRQILNLIKKLFRSLKKGFLIKISVLDNSLLYNKNSLEASQLKVRQSSPKKLSKKKKK